MFVIQVGMPGLYLLEVRGDAVVIAPKAVARQFVSILEANNFREQHPVLMIGWSTVEEL